MKKIEFFYEGLAPLDNLKKLVGSDDALFFDIETTGLSRQKNHIYLIGVGYYSDLGLNIVQWFAENESEESLVLKEFLDFSSSFSTIVNYNGKSFDIPFTSERISKYGLKMHEFNSIDIHLLVKPLKKILSLDDLTQKSIERFLKIKRNDKYNGGELIHVYKHYISSSSPSSDDFDKLILHNKEDVLNMHYLTKILDYNALNNIELLYSSHETQTYNDYLGVKKEELLVYGNHNINTLPSSFNNFINLDTGAFILNFMNNGALKIRIPVVSDTLYYYFENYKDYYYLPLENMCILKSMAGGVLKENRVNATKENCRVALSDSFLPIPPKVQINAIKVFKSEYKSKNLYIRLSDFEALSVESKSKILTMYYNLFVQ